VALLFSGGATSLPSSPTLSSTVVQPGTQGVNLVFSGILSNGLNQVPWMGLNSSGQPVASGVYFIQVVVADTFGDVSTYNLSISVLAPKGRDEIDIFNSAGELVFVQSFLSLTQTVTNLSLDQYTLVPSFDNEGNALASIKGKIQDNGLTLAPWSWDGRNMSGQVVSPGIYTIQLLDTVPGAPESSKSWQIQVLASTDTSDADPIVLDSPIRGDTLARNSGNLVIRYQSAATTRVEATLYNLAGERVSRAADASPSGTLFLSAQACSSGVYLVVFEYWTPANTLKRSTFKIALVR
jgi:hypothetical protein